MIKIQTPLETVASIKKQSTLDVDTNQCNRHCILLNTKNGKEAYYFATPIYNLSSRKLINRQFMSVQNGYRLIGSSCEVIITSTQIKFLRQEHWVCVNFGGTLRWILQDNVLISDRLTIIPTYNGIAIRGRVEQLWFDVTMNLPYNSVRKSRNCVCFMESQFKPIFVVSSLYSQKSNNECNPLAIKYKEENKSHGTFSCVVSDHIFNQGIVEFDFYESKLIQDTPVSGKHPKENNAFGPIAFIGKSNFYGTQWLYSRLDIGKILEVQNKLIYEIKMHIPKISQGTIPVDLFHLTGRFCSFGSTWDNKIPKSEKHNAITVNQDYICVDLTSLYVNQGRFVESSGVVFVPGRSTDFGNQVFVTGDTYLTPPVISIRYANNLK